MQATLELLTIPVTRRLDLRGETCPTTSAETLRILEDMGAGEVLEVESDYEPARSTIPYHCDKLGYRHVFVPSGEEATAAPRTVWRIRIQRT